jgi:hypothetical protein
MLARSAIAASRARVVVLSFRAARRRDDVGVLAATRAATRRAARMHDSNARVGRVGPSVEPWRARE